MSNQESAGDPLLRSVSQLADLARTLRNHPESSSATSICALAAKSSTLEALNQNQVTSRLRSAATATGEDILGLL